MSKRKKSKKSSGSPTATVTPLDREKEEKEFDSRFTELKCTVWSHRNALRMMLNDDIGELLALNLDFSTNDGYERWLWQAESFYRKTMARLDDIGTTADYGLTKEEIENTLDTIKKLSTSRTFRKRLKEEKDREEFQMQDAFQKLHDFMEPLNETLLTICKDEPEQVIKLGLAKTMEEAQELIDRNQRRQWLKKDGSNTQAGNKEQPA